MGPNLYIVQNVIYFALDVDYGINIACYRDMINFLAVIKDNYEHKTIIRVEKPLVEE